MKPWGRLDWLLDRLPLDGPLHVVGCLAPEDRCAGAPLAVGTRGVDRYAFLVIRDASSRFSQRIETKIARNRRRLAAIPVAEEAQAGLLTDDQHIVDAFESLVDARAEPITLLLDITCLPKRFFFFMVKLAVTDRRVRTLIATYTQPAPGGYAREHLAEDPEDVRALPGFGPFHDDPDTLVVGVGFEPLGLPQLTSEFRDKRRRIIVLLPFPPGQPYSRRIWGSLIGLGLEGSGRDIRRVSALDAFEADSQVVDSLYLRVMLSGSVVGTDTSLMKRTVAGNSSIFLVSSYPAASWVQIQAS